MRIITRFESKWDEAIGRYVTVPGSEESFDYEGPIARCDLGGGSSTTTNVNVPPPTEAELAAQKLQLQELQRQNALGEALLPIQQDQLKALQAQIAQQAEITKQQFPVQQAQLEAMMQQIKLSTQQLEFQQQQATREQETQAKYEQFLKDMGTSQAEIAAKSLQSEQELRALYTELSKEQIAGTRTGNEILREQLKAIQEGGKPTPAQIEAIDAATAAAQKTGEADIERFRTATLRQINEEIASASGLRPTDTPIVNLSERAGEEAARQQGMLTSNLAGVNAQARLNIPMAQASLVSGITSSQNAISRASSEFQAQLQQRAQDNRFRLFSNPNAGPMFSTPNSFGLGLNTSGSPGQFSLGLANQRAALAGRSSTTENGLGLGQIGQFAGGVGGLLEGASIFAGAGGFGALFSDRRLKKNIHRVGTHACGVPLYEFEYIWGGGRRTGVMGDDVLKVNSAAVSKVGGYLVVHYDML